MAKRRKHRAEDLVRKLQEADVLLKQGKALAVVLQQLEVTEPTYHRWRKEYDGMGREQMMRLKELERENAKLKSVVADLALDNRMLKDVVEGKL